MDVHYETDFGVFEWDADKAAINRKKYGISFYLAVQIFDDPHIAYRNDDVHS